MILRSLLLVATPYVFVCVWQCMRAWLVRVCICLCVCMHVYMFGMGWLRSVGSIKLYVSCAEYCLFYKGLFAKETYILIDPTNRSHPICVCVCMRVFMHVYMFGMCVCLYACVNIPVCVCVCVYKYWLSGSLHQWGLACVYVWCVCVWLCLVCVGVVCVFVCVCHCVCIRLRALCQSIRLFSTLYVSFVTVYGHSEN